MTEDTLPRPVAVVDMDGVLVDWWNAALAHHGCPDLCMADCDWGLSRIIQRGGPKTTDPAFWKDMGRAFWAGLPWTPEGDELIRGIEGIFGFGNVAILTAPCGTDGCRDGKMDWIIRHLPRYEGSTFQGVEKEKLASPFKVLVDDYDGNLNNWRARGGSAVQVPRPWNSGRERTDQIGRFHVREVLAELRSLHARLTRGNV